MHWFAASVMFALATLLVVLALGAPSASAGADDVLLVGDSLAVATRPYLLRMLPDRRIMSSVRSGRTTPWGMARLRRALARGLTPKVVVMSVGSNDGPSATRFASRVRRTLAAVPADTCVVWSTIIRPRRKGAYRALNRVLHLVKRRDRRLVVVDWEHAVTGGAVVLPDGLHADPEGYRFRGAMIADAIQTDCAERGLG